MKHLLLMGLMALSLKTVAGDKGNGGDIIKCQENGKIVYKVLDSLIIKNESNFNLFASNSSEESLKLIADRFRVTLPELSFEFDQFISSFAGKLSIKDGGIPWIKGKLEQVKDENLFVSIPENCDPDPIQTVTYVNQTTPRYYYDPQLMDLIRNHEDELSWILVHEFLREYAHDADIIRLINGYLHSEEFITSWGPEVSKSLITLGADWRIASIRTYVDAELLKKDVNFLVEKIPNIKPELKKLLAIDVAKLSARGWTKFKMQRAELLLIGYSGTKGKLANACAGYYVLKNLELTPISKEIEASCADIEKLLTFNRNR